MVSVRACGSISSERDHDEHDVMSAYVSMGVDESICSIPAMTTANGFTGRSNHE